MSDQHAELQEKILDMFRVSEDDSVAILDFAIGEHDWEDLSDDARERLYSHYEKTMPYGTATAKTADPYVFIKGALRKDLKL